MHRRDCEIPSLIAATTAMQLRKAHLGETSSLTASQAKAEAETFEADLAYQQVLTRLKALTGQR
jgi:hypothetical protein